MTNMPGNGPVSRGELRVLRQFDPDGRKSGAARVRRALKELEPGLSFDERQMAQSLITALEEGGAVCFFEAVDPGSSLGGKSINPELKRSDLAQKEVDAAHPKQGVISRFKTKRAKAKANARFKAQEKRQAKAEARHAANLNLLSMSDCASALEFEQLGASVVQQCQAHKVAAVAGKNGRNVAVVTPAGHAGVMKPAQVTALQSAVAAKHPGVSPASVAVLKVSAPAFHAAMSSGIPLGQVLSGLASDPNNHLSANSKSQALKQQAAAKEIAEGSQKHDEITRRAKMNADEGASSGEAKRAQKKARQKAEDKKEDSKAQVAQQQRVQDGVDLAKSADRQDQELQQKRQSADEEARIRKADQ